MKQKQRKQQQISIKLKAVSLRRYTKLIKHQPDSSRKKRERTQINKIRNEKGEVTTDTAEIQSILRDDYKQLYAKKWKPGRNGQILRKV